MRRRGITAALPWIGPSLVLIAAVVAFPACYMVWTSTRDLSAYGQDRGSAGLANYRALFAISELGSVLGHTVVWVVGVVLITLLLSAALAQFLNKDFPGRTAVRMAILVPWAASVVMTTTIFYYLLDPDVGIANRFLVDIGLLDRGYGFTKQPTQAFLVAMGVAVFVSVPFTTYTILAGLQSIPAEIEEAGRVDGASAWQRYRHLTLPQLRPAIAVATIINIINVFNSLPILQVITGSIAGFSADTTTTLTFKLIRQNQQVDTAAAMSVLNFALIAVIIAIYVKLVRPAAETDR
ncbi:sugar ABC transporter permease [Nocardia implantans]|uniref:Sugar ABC transporter permease n=1 Tax=Nocardia implantans TaxID=3108168 RepID=A0ABU6B4D1_9NOCA|nr:MULTISPECIES: sugar ABC transporter permease [unclassified Nocardia]MBF6193239.1 sugar ABC transporter permease [Nocardia beijingensis]MEA3531624.1 sugar ABC transporter permease [Nocardia sp. CDC192]MEB3514617.1 sugar ABC transporter permease [Nocardia sp. CDC186]